MITGVQDVYYNVSDVAKAVEFYTETLGMTLNHADQYWASLSIGGVQIGLHWAEGVPVPSVPRDAHGAHAGATLTLRTDNAEGDKAMLEKCGVQVLGYADAPWGKMVVFEDPDGNVLKLMEPK